MNEHREALGRICDGSMEFTIHLVVLVGAIVALATSVAGVRPASAQAGCKCFRDLCRQSSSGDYFSVTFQDSTGWDSGPFWDPLFTWAEEGDPASLERVLQEYLVDSPRGSHRRTWALIQLRSLTWIIDFTPFKRVFWECDLKSDYACSQVFVENQLVFGSRDWKLKLLRKAVTARRSGSYPLAVGSEMHFGGQVFEMSPLDAAEMVAGLGLFELFPDALDVWELAYSGRITDAVAGWKNVLTASEELLADGSHDGHPADLLVDRMADLGPRKIRDRALRNDTGLRWIISYYRAALLYEPITASAENRVFEKSERTELMDLIGQAHREFLEAPPSPYLVSTCAFEAGDARIRSILRGGCDRCSFSYDWSRARRRARNTTLPPESLEGLPAILRETLEPGIEE